MTPSVRRTTIFAASLAIVAAALVSIIMFAGAHSASVAPGFGVDLAFAEEMVPHHRNAVAMAQLAQEKAGHGELKSLAQDIISAQTQEIARLKTIDQRLMAAGVTPAKLLSTDGHDMMAMGSASAMKDGAAAGTAPISLSELRTADPFDQAFIDAMIPHHQMAILMARDVLSRGKDSEVRKIASAVIAAQSNEIQQMNAWRRAWFGGNSPAGGIPA